MSDGGEGGPDFGDLIDELETLGEAVDDEEEREQVREAVEVAMAVQESRTGIFGRVVHGFDRQDAAQALVGGAIFGIPMFVEGGTLEIGAFLADAPLAVVATHAATVALAVGLLYVADIQDVRVVGPLFGVVPRRLVAVLLIPLVTALAVMTAWGRISWADPWLAFCQTTVAYAPMVIGAALGDILPGN
jgi:uncharacterized membrane protein